MSMSKDTAYTAGIMHDLGRLALAVIRPAEYAALLVSHKGTSLSILGPERALFGYDHCQAGLFLIADWNLSPDFQLILDDHHSGQIGEGRPWRVDDIIKVSCRMADTAGFAAFAGCEATPYPDLLQLIPERERTNLWPDFDSFRFEVSSKINTIEMIT
jgi:HDOD domain